MLYVCVLLCVCVLMCVCVTVNDETDFEKELEKTKEETAKRKLALQSTKEADRFSKAHSQLFNRLCV